MIKKYLVPFVFLTLSGCIKENTQKIQIMHTAQSGVFIQSGSKKVFIDALFKSHPKWNYPAPPEEMLDSMEQALPPYNDIDLILVTHAHVDHFHWSSLEKVLMNNPEAMLVTTPRVYKVLRKRIKEYERIQEQIFAPQIEYQASVDTVINDIPLHISHLKHSDDEEWPDIVYSFLTDIGGKRILHNAGSTGYFTDEYKKIRYDTMNIDIAILYHHFLSDTSANGKQIIDAYIKPKFLLVSHKDHHTNAWMDSLGNVYANDYPTLKVMARSREVWEF